MCVCVCACARICIYIYIYICKYIQITRLCVSAWIVSAVSVRACRTLVLCADYILAPAVRLFNKNPCPSRFTPNADSGSYHELPFAGLHIISML